jgi:hypothetical protein
MTEPNAPMTSRRDPLSSFLLAAAVLLAVMYGLETFAETTLEKQTVAAAAIGATAELPQCQVGAAGHNGKALVVRCTSDVDTALEAMANLDLTALASFDTVYLHARERALVCSALGANWTERCTTI